MSPITRREFIKLVNKGLVVTGAAAIVGPVVAYFYPRTCKRHPQNRFWFAPWMNYPLAKAKP